MHKVKLLLVVGCSPRHTHLLQHIAVLPFPPFNGLLVEDGDVEGEIESVCVDIKSGEVHAYVRPVEISWQGDEKSTENLVSGMVENYLSYGWERYTPMENKDD